MQIQTSYTYLSFRTSVELQSSNFQPDYWSFACFETAKSYFHCQLLLIRIVVELDSLPSSLRFKLRLSYQNIFSGFDEARKISK